MKITKTALNFSTTVYVLILFIVIIGGVSYKQLPLEASPDVQIPMLLVSTVYPGVSPEDMERLVTNIIEKELKDLRDVKKMTSSSAESVSTVTIEFESGVDLDVAYQKVRDKIDKSKRNLPADAEEPAIIEINFSDFPIMLVNVAGPYGLTKIKTVAEGLKDKIEAIQGVLAVDLTGGLEREIQILLDPKQMEFYKIGVGAVLSRIQQEHRTTPAGNLELDGNKYSVRIPGEYKDVKLMENIVIKAPGGNPIYLRDIGRVVDGFEEQETISRIDGSECVTLKIKKRSGENIVYIADEVRKLMETERELLPAGTTINIRQDQSKQVRDTVSDLENSIITGLLLVLGVLLFAMGIRNAFFVAIAIPLSMLLSFIVIISMDITLNMVVLFSLILALGMLVDNSIVVVENIFRHVSEGKNRVKAAFEATSEVAWPIIASTLTTVTVFIPLLFWPGIMGDFMKYLPITVIAVLSSSLFVALVINPVVAAGFLKPSGKKMFDETSGEARGFFSRQYQKMLNYCLLHPIRILILSFSVLIGTIGLFSQIGNGVEFFPNTTPERAQIIITGPQGTVLSTTDELVKRAAAIAAKEDNVKNIVSNVGVVSDMFGAGGGSPTHSAVIDLEFKDRVDRTHSTWDNIKSIREELTKLEGAEYRIEVEKNGPPTGAPVSIEVSGPEFAQLNIYAQEIKKHISGIDGVVDIKDDYESGKPEIRVEIDREKAKLRKVNTQSISTAVRAAVNGIETSVLREGDEEFDIVVRYDQMHRKSLNDLENIRVTGGDDVQIHLKDVAKIHRVGGLGSINHIDQKRTIAVTGDVSGRSAAEIMMDVEKLLAEKMKLAPGYSLKFSGESEQQEETQDFLGKAFGIGIMLMLLILITQFNSIMRPLIILGSVVLSMVGVFVGLMITGNKFGIIMTGVGIISLAGVVVNNAIVLIDYADKLKKNLGLPLKEALLKAGVVRFRPVLLTAVTTVLGLMPMALEIGIDFRSLRIDMNASTMEWWGPMARAVVFGLVFATILTLIVVPAMYVAQENMKAWFMRLVRGTKRSDTKKQLSTEEGTQKETADKSEKPSNAALKKRKKKDSQKAESDNDTEQEDNVPDKTSSKNSEVPS